VPSAVVAEPSNVKMSTKPITRTPTQIRMVSFGWAAEDRASDSVDRLESNGGILMSLSRNA